VHMSKRSSAVAHRTLEELIAYLQLIKGSFPQNGEANEVR
jgi:hypothetical protein